MCNRAERSARSTAPRGLVVAALLGALVGPTGTAISQDGDPAASALKEITLQTIDDFRAKVKSSSLDEETRAKIDGLTDQASDHLRRVADWTTRAARFNDAEEAAPEQLQQVRAEIALPEPEPPAGPDESAPAKKARRQKH